MQQVTRERRLGFSAGVGQDIGGVGLLTAAGAWLSIFDPPLSIPRHDFHQIPILGLECSNPRSS